MNIWESKRKHSPLVRSFNILDKKDKTRFSFVMLIQIFLGLLDLLGVAILGLLGALSLNGVQSRPPGDRISSFLSLAGLGNDTFQVQAAALAVAATLILVARTVISIILSKRILFFLSRRGAIISSNLIRKMLSQSILNIQGKSTFENLYSLTFGVSNITIGILGTAATLVADLSLLFILALGLFIVDSVMAMSTIVFFSLIGFSLYRFMHKKARILGEHESMLNIQSNERITEVFSSYRESVVRNRRDYYAREIGALRLDLSNTLGELAFMPNISKYIIESSVVVGALAISATQFIMQDAGHAVATLAVFLAAGTRIAPAVLRVQQGAIHIRRSIGAATTALDLIDELKDLPEVEPGSDALDVSHSGFSPSVRLNRVSFTYPDSVEPAISEASLDIAPGSVVAIVGPSGAGKTTLIDLILGVLEPESGEISISGLTASQVAKKWPGALSYVPQDVMISNGSFLSNVKLGFPADAGSDELVEEAIKTAQLKDFIDGLPEGLQSKVGDRGTALSGGQRQRLGIARALFTKPKLLVLDEATSALDGETEANISAAIGALKGEVTVILIAHRLSTVRDADKVVYMEAGKIIAAVTFDEVRNSVPNFDRQASLMGL